MTRLFKPWLQLRELPASIRVLVAATFINRLGALGVPFLVLYLSRERGFPEEGAALALSAYGVGALAAGPLSAVLVRRFGTGRTISAGLFFAGVCQVSFPFAPSPAWLIALAVAWALAGETVRPASFTHVANSTPAHQQKSAFVALRLAVNLGLTLGPMVAGVLAARSYALLFVFDGVTSLAAAVAALKLSGSTIGERAESAASSALPSPQREFYAVLGASLGIALIFYQFISTLPLFIVGNLRLSETTYAAMFALNGLLILTLEPPLTAATERMQPRTALALGALLMGCGFASSAVISGLLSACAMTVIWSAGEMLFFPAAPAFLGRAATPALRARYQIAYATIWNIGLVFGPVLGTLSLKRLPPRVHWLGIGAVGAMAAALVWLALKPLRSEHQVDSA